MIKIKIGKFEVSRSDSGSMKTEKEIYDIIKKECEETDLFGNVWGQLTPEERKIAEVLWHEIIDFYI